MSERRRALCRRPRRLALPGPGEQGFTLLEVMVALFILAMVCITAATVFVSSVRKTAQLSLVQRATDVATQQLEAVQGVPVSQLLVGRSRDAVRDLVSTAPMAALLTQDVLDSDVSGEPTNYDPAATATSVPVVPIVAYPQLQGTVFTVRTSINRCYLDRTTQRCRREPAGGVAVLRATVQLSWGGASCSSCRYAVSALLDPQPDPEFRLATTRPVVVTTSPDRTPRGTSRQITLVGRDFAPGAVITVSGAGGSVVDVAPSRDRKQATARWTAGTVPGAYVLTLTNPDGGRAEYTPLYVQPVAGADCVVASGAGAQTIDVRSNDDPAATGTVDLVGGSAGFTVSADRRSLVHTPSGTADATASYVLTVNGATSEPVRVTVKGSGRC